MVASQLALLFGCALIVASHQVASGLRITSIEVPSAVMNSSQVNLACNYELQGDQLYSVKWYKNYVEFYRFQPTTTTNPAAAQDSQQQQQQQLNFGTKQEFELEGINLNLSKSNATHVHLKQTSLSSEGTYKCEISADTPSFATVSSERQMKVYLLPRQKVSIVDNTKQQSAPLNTNDLVNLTCVSAPSRPVARLRWLINDSPVHNSSKWLIYHGSSTPDRGQTNQQLADVRLTLAFRFQPNIAAQVTTNQTKMSNNNFKPIQTTAAATNKQLLEFKCIAEFALEFASETSIAVAGGKTTQLKRRHKDRQPTVPASAGQSLASLLMGQQLDETTPDHLRPINSAFLQTTGATVQRLRVGADSPRPLSAGNQTAAAAAVAPVRHQLQQNQPQAGVVMLTSKQLRAKADQIEQLLRVAHPNELQRPLIEARSQVLDYADLEVDSASGGDGDDDDETAGDEKLPPGVSEETAGADRRVAEEDLMRPLQQDDNIENENNKDYQLNELVLFTCSPQPTLANVHFKWLINNNEINSDHINHFDGSRFVLQQPDQKHHQSAARRRRPSQTNPSQSSSRDSPPKVESANLLIEFTPSLFQLKELDLKCRTSIEQPLVEYETILASIGQQISPPGYIEADQQSSESSTSRGQHNRPWVLRQQNSQQQQRRNQVLRLQKHQQQSSFCPESLLGGFSLLQSSSFFLFNLLIVGAAVVGRTR